MLETMYQYEFANKKIDLTLIWVGVLGVRVEVEGGGVKLPLV